MGKSKLARQNKRKRLPKRKFSSDNSEDESLENGPNSSQKINERDKNGENTLTKNRDVDESQNFVKHKVAKLSKPNEPMDGDIKVRIGNLNFQGTLRKAGNRDNCMTFDILLNDSNNNRFMGHLLLNEHSEGNNSEFPQIHASSRMQKDEEDTDEEVEHIKKFQIPHTEYHKSLQTKVSEAEIQNGHWINEKKLEPQQFSWKYQEGTNITPKKQNQRWTHISFVGDTMLVNRDKFNDYSPYLGIEIPKMVTGERTQTVNEKFPVSKESQST